LDRAKGIFWQFQQQAFSFVLRGASAIEAQWDDDTGNGSSAGALPMPNRQWR
jgi:hypothetical protein